jgi:hypothetical protein
MIDLGTRSASVDPLSSRGLRDAILSHHDALRSVLAETVGRTDPRETAGTDLEALRAGARRLYETVEAHLAFEERALPPALRDVIGWGSVLQERIEEDHRRLREVLATALSALEPEALSWLELASDMRAFVAVVLSDLEREDEALLDAQLDAIANDSEGG